jgi:hypothetical protein
MALTWGETPFPSLSTVEAHRRLEVLKPLGTAFLAGAALAAGAGAAALAAAAFLVRPCRSWPGSRAAFLTAGVGAAAS